MVHWMASKYVGRAFQGLWVRPIELTSWVGLFSAVWLWAVTLPLSLLCKWREQCAFHKVRTKWGGEKHTNILSSQLECSGHSVHPQSGKVLETTCREMVKAVTPRAVQLQSPGSELLTILPRSSFYS